MRNEIKKNLKVIGIISCITSFVILIILSFLHIKECIDKIKTIYFGLKSIIKNHLIK